jgi:tetratricopeptide (TPR) repeat protein
MSRFDWIEFEKPAAAQPAQEVRRGSAPADAEACYRMARQLREAGNFNAAVQWYEKALGFDEHHHRTWIELIDSLVRARRIKEADDRSREALANYGQVRTFYASRALVLGYQERYAEAMRQSDISIDEGSAAWYGLMVRAELLLRKDSGYREEAVRLLEEALNAAEVPWEVYFVGGRSFMHARLPTFAASFLAEAAHFNPRSPITWFSLGEAFRHLRLYDQALFYYNRALELDPGNANVEKRAKDVRVRVYGLLQTFLPVELRERWKKRAEQFEPEEF